MAFGVDIKGLRKYFGPGACRRRSGSRARTQQITGLLIMVLSLVSGIWFALDGGWFQRVAEASPLYWAGQAARDAMQRVWVGWHGVAVIAIWTVVVARIAARRYQQTAARVWSCTVVEGALLPSPRWADDQVGRSAGHGSVTTSVTELAFCLHLSFTLLTRSAQ